MASRSIASTVTAFNCPLSCDFGYAHGTSPTVCNITLPGEWHPPLGMPFGIAISNSVWYGYTISWNYNREEAVTAIQSVDWRDRLHDVLVFAQFNMSEEDGRTYHLQPNDWQTQRRTYLSRELDQNDYYVFQDLPPDTVLNNIVGSSVLYSCWTLLRWLADTYGFQLLSDTFLRKILQNTFPPNIDWNGGVKVIDCVQHLCDKANVQFTCIGTNIVRFTLRGYTDNPFMQAFLAGMINTCQIGADRANLGMILHDRGRRVMLQGDRDRYETMYVCHPNWNPTWTWDLAYGGIALGALLDSLGLTMKSKIKEMPPQFHDYETWLGNPELLGKGARPLRRTRMEMRIEEYIDEVVCKIYVVDFSAKVIGFESTEDSAWEGTFQWIDRETLLPDMSDTGIGGEPLDLVLYPREFGWDDGDFNSLWPIAGKLVTESNAQSIIYATSREIISGAEFPFYTQQTFIPKTAGGGASFDVEEIINPLDGRTEYRCRVIFPEPQLFMKPGNIDPYDPNQYSPDIPIVLLAQEAGIYTYRQGPQGLRVREQRINVPNLSRGFIQDWTTGGHREVSILTRNFAHDLEDHGVVPAAAPVRADDVAASIAKQLLFRQALQQTGNFTFFERSGMLPDGIIDSVRVTWGRDGVIESVNFGTPLDNTRDILPPQMARLSFRFLDETELNRRRLEWSYRLAMEEAKRRAAEKKADPGDAVMKAGISSPAMALKTSGRHGIAKINYKRANFPAGLDNIKAGDVVFG